MKGTCALKQWLSCLCGLRFGHPHPTSIHAQVKKGVNKLAAAVFAWSIQIAMKGVWPELGFNGEQLKGYRASVKGKPLAQGWKQPACK